MWSDTPAISEIERGFRQFNGSAWDDVIAPPLKPHLGVVLCTVTYTDILTIEEADLQIPPRYRIPGTVAYRMDPSSLRVLATPVRPVTQDGARRWKSLSRESHAEVERQVRLAAAAEPASRREQEASNVLMSFMQES